MRLSMMKSNLHNTHTDWRIHICPIKRLQIKTKNVCHFILNWFAYKGSNSGRATRKSAIQWLLFIYVQLNRLVSFATKKKEPNNQKLSVFYYSWRWKYFIFVLFLSIFFSTRRFFHSDAVSTKQSNKCYTHTFFVSCQCPTVNRLRNK